MSFTVGVNGPPPSFDSQTDPITTWNSIPAALGMLFSTLLSKINRKEHTGVFGRGIKSKITFLGGIQLPASGGNGDDEWQFLFAALPDPNWQSPLNIGVYIIEMQELGENETSTPLSLYNGQEFLYKVDNDFYFTHKDNSENMDVHMFNFR